MAKPKHKPTTITKYFYPYAGMTGMLYGMCWVIASCYRHWSFYYPANLQDLSWRFVGLSILMVAALIGICCAIYFGLRRHLRYEITAETIKTVQPSESNQNSWSSFSMATLQLADVTGVEKVWSDRIVFQLKDGSTFLFPMSGLTKFRRRQALELINTNLQIPDLLRRANCEHAQPFRFSINMLLILTAIFAVTFAGYRFAVDAGVEPFYAGITFAAIIGITSFLMVLIGMAGLVANPKNKWATRFVHYGGVLLAALFLIAMVLPLLYSAMGGELDNVPELLDFGSR